MRTSSLVIQTLVLVALPVFWLVDTRHLPSFAQPLPAPQQSPSLSGRITFRVPSGQGAPRSGRARGGAARGNCPQTALPVTALVPSAPLAHAPSPTEVVGQTVEDYPTFWFYVPFALTPEQAAEFLLLDPEGNLVYSTHLTDSQEQPGIIQVKLPQTITPLQANTTYNWMFQVNCGTGDAISTWGEIQRVALDPVLDTKLQGATQLEQAALYAEHGIWYEALTTLAELHSKQPDDPAITADWQGFLQSTGLAEIQAQPLLPCCSAD